MLPRVSHHYHRLVDVHREVGAQILAGTSDLVYRDRVARYLAGVTCYG